MTDKQLTLEEVKKELVFDQVVNVMVNWFQTHYEDPVHSMPWDDGDYVWLVEERDAEEELTEAFGDIVHESLIAEAVKTVENECTSWVKVSDLDDMDKEAREYHETEKDPK